MAKNIIEPAGIIFKFCLEKSPNNLAAQLGQASFNFLSGNFRSALQGFQGILKQNPQFNEIRSAIGYCFQRLGYREMAMKAFTRVLQIDPQNEAANLALGFLHLSAAESLQTGLLQMKKVFELNRSNAVAQIHLANHFFFKKDLQKAKTLAEGALSHAPSDKIKAEAYFILAKISHVSGNFSEALGNYQLASKLAPEFLPGLYGLGQCFLARGDLDGAAMMFEKILEAEPSCPEAIRLMTLIYSSKVAQAPTGNSAENRSDSLKKALGYLSRALSHFPKDSLILQCAAVLYESVDPQKAVEFHMAAKAEESENFAILNNFVVLKQKIGKSHPEADQNLFKKAQELTNDKTHSLYLKFNEARLLEDSKDSLEKAEEIYKEILKKNPNFLLAHLRLGCISFQRGQYAEAADHFKDVLGADEQNLDAWNCVAATHLKQKAFTPARKSFERVLQKIDKNDPYALVALGNIYIELARQDKAHKHFDEYHKRAGEFYNRALSVDKGNFYAAQGIGLIFADRAMPGEAREVFTQVRAASESIDSTLNQAHSLIELGKYASAATLYSSVIENVKDSGVSSTKMVSFLLYLCRARYLLALDSADFKAADLAIEDARKALEVLPRDEPLKFNLALLLQARATAIRNSQQSEALELLDSAIESVKEAEAILSELKNSESTSKMDSKLISARLATCSQIVKGIQERALQTEKSVKDQTDRLEQLRLQREAQALKESEAQAFKEEQERLRSAEIERSRKELALKMKETEERIKAAAGSYKTKKEETGTDESDNEESSSLKKPAARRSKKRVKTEDENLSGTENDELDELDGITKNRRRRNANKTSSAPLLSKEFISSSSEEDEYDEKAPMDTD